MVKLNLQLCPRCELNYCDEGQEYCRVCLAEIERNNNNPSNYEEKILCPICKSVYISLDEDMCEACLSEKGYDDFDPTDDEKTENNWRSYIENGDSMYDDDDEVNNEEIEEIQNIEKEGLIEDVDIMDIDENTEKQFSEEYRNEFYDDVDEDVISNELSDDELEKDFENTYDDDEDIYDDED